MSAPKQYNNFTVDELAIWLNAIGLGDEVDAFLDNLVDGQLLDELSPSDLSVELGLSKRQIDLIRMNPIPKSPNEYTVEELQTWLHAIGLDGVVCWMFRSNFVDGELLMQLSDQELRDELGMSYMQIALLRYKLRFSNGLQQDALQNLLLLNGNSSTGGSSHQDMALLSRSKNSSPQFFLERA